jgi:hypothetical protein
MIRDPAQHEEYVAALEAVMENVDPADHPGLTLRQRTVLSLYSKPRGPREDKVQTRRPMILNYGLYALHDYPCPVYHAQKAPAILDLNKGVFHPSNKAHAEGWRLIQLRTRFQNFLYRHFLQAPEKS